MMRYFLTVALGTLGLFLLGCADAKTEAEKNGKTPKTEEQEVHNDHPTKGPHEGQLIELGDEEYHAEWLADAEKGTVTVYILDSHAEKMVPIGAEEVTIHAGEESYTLKASPSEGEPAGQSSRFVSEDKALSELMDDHFHAKLVLKIADKSYSGNFDSH